METVRNITVRQWFLLRADSWEFLTDGTPKAKFVSDPAYVAFKQEVERFYSCDAIKPYVLHRAYFAERLLKKELLQSDNLWQPLGSNSIKKRYDLVLDQDTVMLGQVIHYSQPSQEDLDNFRPFSHFDDLEKSEEFLGVAYEVSVETDKAPEMDAKGLVYRLSRVVDPEPETWQLDETNTPFGHLIQRRIVGPFKKQITPLTATIALHPPSEKRDPQIYQLESDFFENRAFKFSSLSTKAARADRRLWDIQHRLQNHTDQLERSIVDATASICPELGLQTTATRSEAVDDAKLALNQLVIWRDLFGQLEQELIHANRNRQNFESWIQESLNTHVPQNHDWQLIMNLVEAECQNFRPHLDKGETIIALLDAASNDLQEEIKADQEFHESRRDRQIALAALLLGFLGIAGIFPDDDFWGITKLGWRHAKAILGTLIFLTFALFQWRPLLNIFGINWGK